MEQFHEIYNKILVSDYEIGEQSVVLSGKYVPVELIDISEYYE